MSASSNLTINASENDFVVSDAVPDPPRFPSNPTIIDVSEKITHSNDSRDNELSKKVIPQSVSNRTNNPNKDSHVQDSTASNTDKQNNDAKHTYKPKKSSKSRKPTTATISLNIVNSKHVNVGSTVKNVFNVNNIQQHCDSSFNNKCNLDPKETDHKRTMSLHVKALSDSKLEMTTEDMLLIKTHMGNGWIQVAKQIGYTQGQIEQFSKNYKQIDEVIYQILLDWKRSCTKGATIGKLISGMWSSMEYECAEMLAAAHTST